MVIFALAAPTLAISVAAAVEYSSLASRQSKLQTATDDAALTGAQQLRLANSQNSTIASVAQSVVSSVAPTPVDSSTTVVTSVDSKRTSVTVSVEEVVPTLLGKVLSLPTMTLVARSTASMMGKTKLCLLTLDTSKGKALNLDTNASLTAAGCAIYSNSRNKAGLNAEAGVKATAGLICSVGGVGNKGSLSPAPVTDCPAMADPLASRTRPSVPSFCTETSLKITADRTLQPGRYCKGLTVSGSSRVTMLSGTYVLDDGPLIVENTATLSGQNVGLFFIGDAGGMRLDPDTTVSLTAPKSGELAGLLFFEDRSVSSPIAPPIGPKGAPPPPPYGSQPMRQYRITSNNAPTLLGTIYLPAGRLIIDANRPVSDKSAYTVIISRQLDLNSGPNLYLNSDYGATDVPVPDGVGPRTGAVSLTK